MNTETVAIMHSIDETFDFLFGLNCNAVVYYHNLKFDGSFWLPYLFNRGFTEALRHISSENYELVEWLKNKEMQNNQFKYSISHMGQWYTVTIKMNDHIIELRDSLKLLPFSVKEIGKAFKTKHQKLDMEYKGFRYAGCEITPKEKEYIANDVLVVKEALEIMYEQGHTELTIGACCLKEFKRCYDKTDYANFFPDLYDIPLDQMYDYPTAGDYIKRSYKGGWCYLVKGKENKIYRLGTTGDVNSLYPSMMHSESGNRYPVGLPKFWKGNFIPDEAIAPNKYYFVRIKTRFYIKPNKLPFIQIKGSFLYKSTEMLETSDIYNKKTKQYEKWYLDFDGNIHDTRVELTLTMTDYILLQEHYDLVECEILDGCYFYSEIGLFDEYIDKYKKIKLESKGALRTLAKLFLNNLYGKMASNKDSSFKHAYIKDDGSIGYIEVEEYNKTAGYIAIGSAITSYARNFTIRAAQANYHGVDKPGFIYADTDSIHCDLQPSEMVGIKVHDKNFCCWKLESCWDVAIFARQKTYIEHITHENLEPVEVPHYEIKCAGMPKKCKDLFERSMDETEITDEERVKYNADEIRFLYDTKGNQIHRTLEDFKIGLQVPGKLVPVQIKGGTVLVDRYYTMR